MSHPRHVSRFLVEAPVRKSAALRSTLSHALCHLISSMDDLMPQVIICVPQYCHQYFCESAYNGLEYFNM